MKKTADSTKKVHPLGLQTFIIVKIEKNSIGINKGNKIF